MATKQVVCLPIAGIGNPYQHLMMQGLREAGLNVRHGIPGKFFALLKTALKIGPDYLHLDWLHQYYLRRKKWMTWAHLPFFVAEVFIIRKLLRVRLVWTLHNIFPHDWPTHGPYRWARQFFASQCEWIRVFDEGTVARASRALKVPPEKFRVVPEGSYVGYYPDQTNRESARKKLRLPDSKRIFLYLGLIKPYKGVVELAEAFRECRLSNGLLLIAGRAIDPDYWQKAQEKAQHPSIILREGFVPDEELQYYFHAADVAVLPFQSIENSGSAILAMGFNKPVIAPHKGVLKSRLSQQEILLYEDDGLKNTLQKSAQMTTEELRYIGKKNYEALKKYQWEDFASCFQ